MLAAVHKQCRFKHTPAHCLYVPTYICVQISYKIDMLDYELLNYGTHWFLLIFS